MNEWFGIGKIGFFFFTGGVGIFVSILGFLIRRELNRNKAAQDNLHEDIKELRSVQNNQRQITSEHDKSIAVMNAEKVGRPELKEEMYKIQQGFESKLAMFRDDIKEDIKELKDIMTRQR